MSPPINPKPDERLKEVARRFQYPSTPDVAGAVLSRLNSEKKPGAGRCQNIQVRSAWAVIGLLVLVLAVLFMVPGVRAEIIRFFQVGVVRIFPAPPTLTAESPSIQQQPTTATPMAVLPGTENPVRTATPSLSQYEPPYTITMSGLAGETSLADVQASLSFPIRLPVYPADLGLPDRVFLQADGQMVILVWSDPANPQKARLSLHEFGSEGTLVSKFGVSVIQETQVDGEYAVWAQGPYLVQLTSGAFELRRIVEGNTLIWEVDGITYRLESDLSLEETIQIAESLR